MFSPRFKQKYPRVNTVNMALVIYFVSIGMVLIGGCAPHPALAMDPVGNSMPADRPNKAWMPEAEVASHIPANAELSVVSVGHVAVVQWTLDDRQSSYFLIERCLGKEPFERIDSIAVNGIRDKQGRYTWVDHTPLDGKAHYRLKEVLLSDEVRMSEPVTLLRNMIVTEVQLQVHAAGEVLEFRFPEGTTPCTVEVARSTGEVEMAIPVQPPVLQLRLDLQALPSSACVVNVRLADGTSLSKTVARRADF